LRQYNNTDTKPWYRQFWFWFIVTLPACVVVAGIGTVIIAFRGADALVSDNYYRDGLQINQRLEQDQKAQQLTLSADIRFDVESGELFVVLQAESGPALDFPDQLHLLLLHPMDDEQDRTVLLKGVKSGQYRADLKVRPQYRYYLRLLPEQNPVWRLNGEIDFEITDQVRLEAQ